MTCSLLAVSLLPWNDLTWKAFDSYFSHCLVVPPSEPLVWKNNQCSSKWQHLFHIQRPSPALPHRLAAWRNHSYTPTSSFSLPVGLSTCTHFSQQPKGGFVLLAVGSSSLHFASVSVPAPSTRSVALGSHNLCGFRKLSCLLALW